MSKARRLRGLLITFAIVGVVLYAGWIERAPIFQGAANLWAASDPIEKADAIVVLGGGLNVRPFAAAELYKRGFASQILVSNVRLSPVEKLKILPTHTELNREVLLKLEIPPDAISTFGEELSNSYEEARAIRAWAEAAGAKRLIIPTESFSTRRVRWIFGRELRSIGAVVIVDSVPPLEYGPDDWWQHEQGVVSFQNEVLKYLYYRMKY